MIEDLKHKFENYKPYINGYKNMKRASVLIPIVKKDNMHYILFQVRSKNLKSQPNEISFPGGKIENNESPLDAVIRETCEELGTNVKNVNIISEIDLLITPGTSKIFPPEKTFEIHKDVITEIEKYVLQDLETYKANK